MTSNRLRVERIALALPEAERVDVVAWGGRPTYRVRSKTFVFGDVDGTRITVKLDRSEAEAVVATDFEVHPADHGLGRSGWVRVDLGSRPSAARWREIEDWICTSYVLVAPRRLAQQVRERSDPA